MTTLVKCVVELPSASNITEDTVVNTFVVGTAASFDPEQDPSGVTTPLSAFYTSGVGLPQNIPVGAYLSDAVSRVANACRIKLYDLDGHMDGSPTGPPVAETGFTMPAAVLSTQYPSEVACVVTLRAQNWELQPLEGPLTTLPTPEDAQDYGAPATFQGRPRPRKRYSGRLYLGPLNTGVGVAEVAGHVRPDSSFRAQVLTACERLQDALAANGHGWMLWSRRDEDVRVISEVSMDDAFDIQRRRGAQPTLRETRVLVP